jgi:hypothetical protein
MRVRKAVKHSSFRLEQKIKHPGGTPRSGYNLLKDTRLLLRKTWKSCLLLLFIYLALTIILVYSSAPALDRQQLLDSLKEITGGKPSLIISNLTLLLSLLTKGTGDVTESGQVYQGILFAIFALSYIWVFRQYYLGQKFSAKQALYQGLYPLIQFLLVLMVMALQVLPVIAAASILGFVIEGGIAVSWFEQAVFVLLTFFSGVLSFYMLSSSVFALFVITLPDTTPTQALRSARDLVLYRRWAVMRRILVMPIAALLAVSLIVLPTLVFTSAIAPWVFLMATLGALPFSIAYMFSLYKSLL